MESRCVRKKKKNEFIEYLAQKEEPTFSRDVVKERRYAAFHGSSRGDRSRNRRFRVIDRDLSHSERPEIVLTGFASQIPSRSLVVVHNFDGDLT